MLQRFRLSHTIVLTIALLIIASITWARWAELDQITRAPGTVIPIGRVQIVQSVNGGEIARINVREGGRQEVYYRVSLEVDVSRMRPKEPGEKIVIQPGMTIIAEIKTGKNTVFDYLTKPITKTFSDSLQEK